VGDARSLDDRPRPSSGADAFVGRRKELTDLRPLLREHRLLTLVGSPGVGKTRLAHELVAQSEGGYGAGAWLVELAAVLDAGLVAHAVAAALGVKERLGLPVVESLVEALTDQTRLLVLDNCEHLLDACADLVEVLLRCCPRLTVLATSRETLRVAGEVVYPIDGLSHPDPSTATSLPNLLRSEAVQLFVSRAETNNPGFTLTSSDGPHLAALCGGLDGVPLAIELAAGAVQSIPVADLVGCLEDRFAVLTAGTPTANKRHESLRAAIEWSYLLLPPPGQAVFRRLSVLDGGFGLESAAAVCAGADLPASAILELVLDLEAKSLITPMAGQGGTARFRMLDSLRLYGREQLRAAGEEEAAFDRLAGWLSERALSFFDGDVSLEMVGWIRDEFDNISHTLERMSGGTDDRQLLLATSLFSGCRAMGNTGNTGALLSRALKAAGPDCEYRSKALAIAGGLAARDGDGDEAVRMAREAVELQRRGNEPRKLVHRLLVLASRLQEHTDDEAAVDRVARESLEIARQCGDETATAKALHAMAWIALTKGDPDRAASCLDELWHTAQATTSHSFRCAVLHTAGVVALERNDAPGAETYLLECLELAMGMRLHLPFAVEGLAMLAGRTGRPERALRLVTAAGAMRVRIGDESEGGKWWRAHRAKATAAAIQALPGDRADAVQAAGARLTTQQTIEYARTGIWPEDPTGVVSPLSAREREVVRLVAQGLTNPQIGARLNSSVRTIDAQIRNVRAKLGLRSRAHIAAWAAIHRTTAHP